MHVLRATVVALSLVACAVSAARADKSVTVGENANASLSCTAEGGTIKIVSATYGTLANPAKTCDATARARVAGFVNAGLRHHVASYASPVVS